MHASLDAPSTTLRTPSLLRLSVGPVYERESGRVVKAGLLVIGDGLVAPRPFWELLQRLARSAAWLRATFALASRPTCYGVVRSDGAPPVAGFCGVWRSPPRLTLIVAGSEVAAPTLEADVAACFLAAGKRDDDDPFPLWKPGDFVLPGFWEETC